MTESDFYQPAGFPVRRMRRLRRNAALRDALAETQLTVDELVAPLFVRSGSGVQDEIPSMPGQYQYSVDTALEMVRRLADRGLRSVLLFGIPESKDAAGSSAWDDTESVQRLCAEIKRSVPEMLVMTDVCLCEYTDHGHCGVLHTRRDRSRDVDNDATLQLLAKAAVSHARSGADIVAPSAMMDGQIRAIRAALDDAECSDVAILSYAVKFASGMYGPFRDAAQSPPQFGDRRTYQMDYRSTRQALDEALLDVQEGADAVMVKPAATYLDVISKVRQAVNVPVAAYHVSGEYSMIKAASQKGWLDERQVVMEVSNAIKRSGTDLIISYFAEQLTYWI